MALMFLSRKRNKKSVVNLSHVSPTTLAPGNLIPISFVPIVGGDKVRFSPSSFVQAFPMSAPLVNGFKLCLEYFFIPTRLYNSDLLLDFTGTTDDPDSVKYPSVLPVSLSRNQGFEDPNVVTEEAQNIVSPGSLADYMGFPVGFAAFADEWTQRYNVIKALGYLDVVLNYYVNQQVPYIYTASFTSAYGNDNFSHNVETMEELLRDIKTSKDPVLALDRFIQEHSGSLLADEKDKCLMSWQWLCSRKSIFQRCLPPYYLESWLKTSGYVDAEIKVDLEADGKSISFRNFSAASHVQRWMDLAMAGGSRWSDYLNSEFDTSRVKNHTTPIFLGSDRQYLGSNVIYQTTGAGDASSPLGAFAGQASGGDSFRTRTYSFDEPGYFMVMASLVPDVIYSRGLDPFLKELTLADSYAPALDNIAMEPLMVHELDSVAKYDNVGADGSSIQFSDYTLEDNVAVGYVPAWSKMMQVVSRSHGRLTTELAYWLLNREYMLPYAIDSQELANIRLLIEGFLKDESLSYERAEAVLALLERTRKKGYEAYQPYVLPNFYNDVFADISDTAQNFVLTFSCKMSAYREKGKVNVSTTL